MYFLAESSNVEFPQEPLEKFYSHSPCNQNGSLRKPFQGRDVSIVKNYAGMSLGGQHPTNAYKKNQDSLLMCEDFPTRSLMFVCLDGHGVNGDRVSQFVKQELELRLFSHRLFADDIKGAIRQVLYDLEKKLSMLDGRCGEFSGTTLSMAIIRGNTLVTANVGDSRIVLAKHAQDHIDLMNFRRRSRTDSWSTTGGSFDSLVSNGETDLEQLSLSNSEYSSKTSPENSGMQCNSGRTCDGATDHSAHSIIDGSQSDPNLCSLHINGDANGESLRDGAPIASPLVQSRGVRWNGGIASEEDGLTDSHTSTSTGSTRRSSLSSNCSHSGIGGGVLRTHSPQSEHRKRSRSNLSAEGLTVDHKPDLLQEYNRITSAGGRVFSVRYADGVVGPPRVWLGQSNIPGLAMSRSIGDFVVHTAGVVSTPDITEQELDYDADCMLIVATDGVWDQMSNGEAVNIASTFHQADLAVNAVVEEARTRWLEREKNNMDDITACVVFLQGV